MKTIKTMFVVMVAFFTTNAMASGAGSLKVNMDASNNELTTVDISSANLSHIEIELTSASGKNIYSMETDAPMNSLQKKYDFSTLKDGIYWYTVKIDKESTVNKFEVKSGEIEIIEVRKSIDPFFKFENNMLKMTFLNPENDDVELLIYDDDRKLISKVELGNDFSFSKALDFNGQRFGTYEVVLVNGPDIHEYFVTLE